MLKRIGQAAAYALGVLGVLVILGAAGSSDVGEIGLHTALWRCLCGAAVIGGGVLLYRLVGWTDRRPGAGRTGREDGKGKENHGGAYPFPSKA